MFKNRCSGSAVLTLVVGISIVLSSTAEPEKASSTQKIFENKALHLQLAYPSGWIVKRLDTSNPEVPLVFALAIGEGENTRGGVFVIAFANHASSAEDAIKEMISSYVEKVKKRSPDCKVSEPSDVKVGGSSGKQIDITSKTDDGSYHEMLHFVIHGNTGFTFGYKSLEKDFDEKMFKAVLDSVKWTAAE